MTERADPWSATRLDIHERLRSLTDSGTGTLATIVDVEGSAYRRPGAKLVVDDESESMGAITAGCLEGPLLDLASDVRETGKPRVETFDLTDDDEWGMGLGCNGIIDILLEPIDDSLVLALDELAAKRPAAVLTVVESGIPDVATGARVTVTGDRTVHSTGTRASIPDSVVDRLDPAIDAAVTDGTSVLEQVTLDDGDISVFVDGLEPVHDLVLFGSQNDVHPVSRLAQEVGFRVIVASGRGAKGSADAFPYAHEVRSVRAPDLASVVDADAYTSVVLMSHNFIDDRLALESLLADSEVPYIGLMGPRKRFEEMRAEFEEEGVQFSRDDLDRIATPVGLDVGGGEPVEIALSIVSEVLAVSNDRLGGRLKDSEGTIHPRIDQTQ